eukprot:SAG11_NODE_1364_length_5109_cov_2.966866_1_plen_204_part_10
MCLTPLSSTKARRRTPSICSISDIFNPYLASIIERSLAALLAQSKIISRSSTLCAKRNLAKLARRALLFRRGYPALREYLEGVATKLDGSGHMNRHALRRLALDPEVTDDVQSLVQDKWHKTMRDSDIRESFHLSSEGFFDVDDVDEYERKVSLIMEQPSERKTMRTSLALSARASFGKYGRDSWREPERMAFPIGIYDYYRV